MANEKNNKIKAITGKSKILYECEYPGCNFSSNFKIAYLSHYLHKHSNKSIPINISSDINNDKEQKKQIKPGKNTTKELLKNNDKCCNNPEYRFLSKNFKIEKHVMKLGYTAVCTNCDNLL